MGTRDNKNKRKNKNILAKDNGKGANDGRLEELECSEGRRHGQKSTVNQSKGFMHLLA